MSKSRFELLCNKIQSKVGEKEFRTKNGQGLCGHIRVAIGLRILCGGSYLDLLGRAYGVDSLLTSCGWNVLSDLVMETSLQLRS